MIKFNNGVAIAVSDLYFYETHVQSWCHKIVAHLRRVYPNIKMEVVLTPQSNRWLCVDMTPNPTAVLEGLPESILNHLTNDFGFVVHPSNQCTRFYLHHPGHPIFSIELEEESNHEHADTGT